MLTIFGKKKKDDSSVQIDTGKDAGQAPPQPPSIPPAHIPPGSYPNDHSETTYHLANAECCSGSVNSPTARAPDETNDLGTYAKTTATRRVVPFGRDLSIENPTIATSRHPYNRRVYLQSNAGEHSRIRPPTRQSSQ